jgi:hypothetical protein
MVFINEIDNNIDIDGGINNEILSLKKPVLVNKRLIKKVIKRQQGGSSKKINIGLMNLLKKNSNIFICLFLLLIVIFGIKNESKYRN